MRAPVVLKFGGSVLRDRAAVVAVAAAIERARGAGESVVAVVSALAGRTDELLAECRAAGAGPFATAARVALGELECGGLLSVALSRCGIDAPVLEPAAIGLRALGPALDADPVAVEVGHLRAALQRHGVVVVPGFVAVDGASRTVLLGRGGSDLTALFLAHALAAPCRLLKDAGGLCDRDPARFATARPLARASYDELQRSGGRLVQHKAVAFARAHAQVFTVAAFAGGGATVVGPAASRGAECG